MFVQKNIIFDQFSWLQSNFKHCKESFWKKVVISGSISNMCVRLNILFLTVTRVTRVIYCILPKNLIIWNVTSCVTRVLPWCYRHLQSHLSINFAIFVHYVCRKDYYYYVIVLLPYCLEGVKNGSINDVEKSCNILHLLELL